jgi:hypothetical protein
MRCPRPSSSTGVISLLHSPWQAHVRGTFLPWSRSPQSGEKRLDAAPQKSDRCIYSTSNFVRKVRRCGIWICCTCLPAQRASISNVKRRTVFSSKTANGPLPIIWNPGNCCAASFRQSVWFVSAIAHCQPRVTCYCLFHGCGFLVRTTVKKSLACSERGYHGLHGCFYLGSDGYHGSARANRLAFLGRKTYKPRICTHMPRSQSALSSALCRPHFRPHFHPHFLEWPSALPSALFGATVAQPWLAW